MDIMREREDMTDRDMCVCMSLADQTRHSKQKESPCLVLSRKRKPVQRVMCDVVNTHEMDATGCVPAILYTFHPEFIYPTRPSNIYRLAVNEGGRHHIVRQPPSSPHLSSLFLSSSLSPLPHFSIHLPFNHSPSPPHACMYASNPYLLPLPSQILITQ